MKIKNMTIIYCGNPDQKKEIEGFFAECGVDTNGVFYCEQFGDTDKINTIQDQLEMNSQDVGMNRCRLIFILENKGEIAVFQRMTKQLIEQAVMNPCLIQLIWKTDSHRMEEIWSELEEAWKACRNAADGNVLCKMILASQRINGGGIRVGWDESLVAKQTVFGACGKLDGTSGVYVYEMSQLTTPVRIIDKIIENLVLRAVRKQMGSCCGDDAKARQEYRKVVWEKIFRKWTQQTYQEQAAMVDIQLNEIIRKFMPNGTDFCVFAPKDARAVTNAIEYFAKKNSELLIENSARMIFDDWQAHIQKLLTDEPGLINQDVIDYLNALAAENVDANVSDLSLNPFEIGKVPLLGKENFYLNQLREAANAYLVSCQPKVNLRVLKLMQEYMKMLASELSAKVGQSLESLNINYAAGQMSDARIKSYDESIVNDIQNTVDKHVKRDGVKKNRCWEQMVETWKTEIKNALSIRNMIELLNTQEDDKYIKNADNYMFRTGVMTNIGNDNSQIALEKSKACCVISKDINIRLIAPVKDACKITEENDITSAENIVCLYEHRLKGRKIYQGDDMGGTDTEEYEASFILPRLACFKGSTIIEQKENRGSRPETEKKTTDAVNAAEPENKTDADKVVLESTDGGRWRFLFTEASHDLRLELIVTVFDAWNAEGEKSPSHSKQIIVGGDRGQSYEIQNDGKEFGSLYGEFGVRFEETMSGRCLGEFRVQGEYIECVCKLKQKKDVRLNDGDTLRCYEIRLPDDSPLVTGTHSLIMKKNGYYFDLGSDMKKIFISDADVIYEAELRVKERPNAKYDTLYRIELDV